MKQKRKRCAVLYALYRDTRTCAWYWPSHHVIAQIEEWQQLRNQTTMRGRRRRIYDALIQGALYGAQYDMPWSQAWHRRVFEELMPSWAVRGLGHRLVDDLHEGYEPFWKSTIVRNYDGSVVSVYDQVYVRGEGWHSWDVVPGKNAVYYGCTK